MEEKMTFACGIFDLDGVLVDTAKYHYLAWKKLAGELGFSFTEEQNEALKGVSRMRSLELLLEAGGLSGAFSKEEMEKLADRKNAVYVEYISKIEKSELFDGVEELFGRMRQKGIKIALGSASKNAGLILNRLDIRKYFDAVIDGTLVKKPKPDPEVFLLAAEALGLPSEQCVVFEDSAAGLEAAGRAGMKTVGIGDPRRLSQADVVLDKVGDFVRFLE